MVRRPARIGGVVPEDGAWAEFWPNGLFAKQFRGSCTAKPPLGRPDNGAEFTARAVSGLRLTNADPEVQKTLLKYSGKCSERHILKVRLYPLFMAQ